MIEIEVARQAGRVGRVQMLGYLWSVGAAVTLVGVILFKIITAVAGVITGHLRDAAIACLPNDGAQLLQILGALSVFIAFPIIYGFIILAAGASILGRLPENVFRAVRLVSLLNGAQK